jgi:5-methylcytosine-specific restriction endonuclease McrA
MQIETLSDAELTSSLDSLVQKQRLDTVELLKFLGEFDLRALYRELGYSSLFDYCVRKLKLSEGAAYRRVSAARCLRGNPEIAEHLLSGEVTLCSVAAAAKSIGERATAVQAIVGCSKREVENLVAVSNPAPAKPREVIKPIVIEAPSTPLAEVPKQEERVKLEFSVSKEAFERFKGLQAELSIEAGKQLSIEEVFERAISRPAKKRVVRRTPVRSASTRYIPKAVKREVFERDKGQCCYLSPDGVRCTERKHLQFDHIRPFARGGLTEVSNLRLLCPGHNRLMAEKEFGREYIHSRIAISTGRGVEGIPSTDIHS